MFKDKSVGFAFCGSFCTLRSAMEQMKVLTELGASVTPIFSFNVSQLDTRFGKAEDFRKQAEEISGKEVIDTIAKAEPIGPNKSFDLLVIAPCTGNTLSKLALGITDTPVTMAAKAHLRNKRPILIAVSTNDALGGSAKNIGQLLNYKNFYFVPMSQDDFKNKELSLVSHMDLLPEAAENALQGLQLQPVMLKK